jgi:hypothetical protein
VENDGLAIDHLSPHIHGMGETGMIAKVLDRSRWQKDSARYGEEV